MKEQVLKTYIHKGTIIEVDFPFSQDPAKSKRRPSLVLWADSYQREFILAFITTKWLDKKETGDIHISTNETGFNQTGLVKDSKIKITKLITLSRNKLVARYGILTKEMVNRINKEILRVFEL